MPLPHQTNEHERTMSSPRLPARLNGEQVAARLGFAPHDIPVLVKAKLLSPLGKPAPNAIKFFAAVVIERLAGDDSWLAKATNAIYGYWLRQNTRRRAGAADAAPLHG
jgi:hypothetical protein